MAKFERNTLAQSAVAKLREEVKVEETGSKTNLSCIDGKCIDPYGCHLATKCMAAIFAANELKKLVE